MTWQRVKNRRLTAHRRVAGFSLLELLVVIATLTLLVAILLPSIRQAHVQAKRVHCRANLHQLAIAWQMYLDANNGAFFRGDDANIIYGGQKGAEYQGARPLNLHLSLEPVLTQGGDVFRCPTDKGGGVVVTTHFEHYGTSYTTNQLLIGPHNVMFNPFDPCAEMYEELNDYLDRKRLPPVHNPGKVILMGDFGWVHTISPDDPFKVEWHGSPRSHNLAFMDGHAEFIKICKGRYVAPNYSFIPFEKLVDDAIECQEEVDCE